MGRNSANNEGDIQSPNSQGRSLDTSLVIETVLFGQRYVGARKKFERERDPYSKYGRLRLIRSRCPMVYNYSIEGLSPRATWAVFKRHLLLP